MAKKNACLRSHGSHFADIHETVTVPDNALDLFAYDIFLSYTFSKKKKKAGGCVRNRHFRLSAPSTHSN
jgi:hypothetical protein